MNDSEYNLLLDVAQERAAFLENPRPANSYISQFPKNLWSVDLLFCTILQQNVTGSSLSAIDNLLIKALGS